MDKLSKAISELQNDKMVILTDNKARENEGDLIFPAENVTPKKIAFMLQHTSGIICMPLSSRRAEQLNLDLMVKEGQNTSRFTTAFTVSIEAKTDVTTGVCAADRSRTIEMAIDDQTLPEDLARPGHIFPLIAHNNGVLGRAGHTEGSIDLVTLAGFKPGAVLCELMNPDGTMMEGCALEKFAKKYEFTILSIDEIIHARLASLPLSQARGQI